MNTNRLTARPKTTVSKPAKPGTAKPSKRGPRRVTATRRDSSDEAAEEDSTGLEQLDPAANPSRDATHFRRIMVAREGLVAAEQELRDAVAAARAAGDSWTVIGAALDTSRQNAFQRFGK